MTQEQVITLMQDAILTVLKCALPLIGVGLVIGIIVSVFQAATQINEQTLSFVPKIIGIFITLLITSGWILTQLSEFFLRVFGYIQQWGG